MVVRSTSLTPQDRVADAIWFVPQSDEAQAHYVLEYSGRGPKAYLNLWLGDEYGRELTEWNWMLHESAVELWRRDSTDEEIIDVLLPSSMLLRERDELRAEREAADRLAQLEREAAETWRCNHAAAVERAERAEAEGKRLRKFVQKVATFCNDSWLAREAEAMGYGDYPLDRPKPR